jgi:hypothetical protein
VPGFSLPVHLLECTLQSTQLQTNTTRIIWGLIGEVGMSTDSSFEDQTQSSVPSKPEPGSDEPTLNPNDPNKYDPLRSPTDDGPDDWKDPAERVTPEADEETPLSDDRR